MGWDLSIRSRACTDGNSPWQQGRKSRMESFQWRLCSGGLGWICPTGGSVVGVGQDFTAFGSIGNRT